MLKSILKEITQKYAFERAKPIAGSQFANFVRRDLAQEAKKRLVFLPFNYTVKASVGNGNWAAVPWLAFFDPIITKSATQGVYIVYLINPIDETVILSMNQGTTIVYDEFGEKNGLNVLRRRAVDLRDLVPEYSKNFDSTPIELGSNEKYPRGYAAGHSFGRTYQMHNIETEQFDIDLENMFHAYRAIVDRGATSPIDILQQEAGTTDIEETRRYILSRRIERTPDVRKKVLAIKPPVCEGCGLDPRIHYSFNGKTINTPLDVHHCRPIRNLSEGETSRYTIPDDFLVLCPTCHRMIHKQDDKANLEELRRTIRFDLPKGVMKNKLF